jgi:quercetin dioxygenase-like cupin family protein
MMDRREFGLGLPALLAVAGTAEAQMSAQGPLPKTLTSGTFKPQPSKTPDAPRVGHQYLLGMLTAGNIRLEMHETIQQPGAEHEAVGTHKHNEIWCVQRGTATLWINGVEHTMEAGDVGLVCAGDQHWIGNKGPGELAYFVITVGPPE